jgi:hypothetical protein
MDAAQVGSLPTRLLEHRDFIWLFSFSHGVVEDPVELRLWGTHIL